MAERHLSTTAPQSTTSSPANPPYTPRSTSIADDSETEFEPTPINSPGGPQYEDLPPSYDFALSDARNGVASLDASQIEAHRVSANEGPDEPEVWEYRMRGEADSSGEAEEHEEAPAYEGHVPVQQVSHSQNIPVGRVGNFDAPIGSGVRGMSAADDPPHSVPEVSAAPAHGSTPDFNSNGHAQHGGFGSGGAHHGQTWSLFGAPGHGPFGAPGNGPFGAPNNNPFHRPNRNPFSGPGRGPIGRGRGGRAGRSGGSRSGSSQDWAAFGQNLGKMGEEFGRRMGNWGEQLGREAGAMGEQIGRQAGAMGQQMGRDTSAWASAYSGRAQDTQAAGSSNATRNEPPQYDGPPSYQGPAGVAGHETGVLHSDRKVDTYPPEKVSEKALEEQMAGDYDDDDSSVSSDSSDSSSSSSDTGDDDYDSAQAAFLARIESIHRAAELASSKGKKSAAEIAHERDLAIAKATREKEDTELNIATKQSRLTQKRELRAKKRELTREYRQAKRELREKDEGKGKGKGKAKKGKEWKEVKREYKAKKRALKRERLDAKRAWKQAKREEKIRRNENSAKDEKEHNHSDKKV